MATAIRLYQRLDSTQGYPCSREVFPQRLTDCRHAREAFYLRYRPKGGRRLCLPAGGDVLQADNQRKVLEARVATGSPIPATAATTAVAAGDCRVCEELGYSS
jgi:hypothetical protein